MNAHEFLKTLALVLGVAAVTTVVFQRLKQPVVLGYIIAGLLVGPHLPTPFHADHDTVHMLSELGVILLMFAIGLELNIAKLVRVAPTAGVIGVLQVAFMMGAGFVVGRAFGWTELESVYAGAAIAISSTTIIAKVFDEMKVADRIREIVYGVLIVEDIIAILLLATMTTVSSGAGLDTVTLAVTTGKLVGFLVGMVVVGLLVVPRLMRIVVRLGRPETTVVASIGLCFGLAYACAAVHYSVALGAFVAGVLISESGEGHTVEHLIVPVRDMFAAIFFVSVGMLIDPRLVIDNWAAVLVLTAVVIAGKIVSVTFGGVLAGCGLRTSVQSGMSLSQIGEFSFIIVGLGLSLRATRPFLFPVAVAVSAITTLTTPSLIQRAPRLALLVEEKLPRPLRSFVTLYSAWLERVRTSPASSTTGARLRRLGLLLVIDSGAVVGLLLGATLLHGRIEQAIEDRFGLDEHVTARLVIALAAAIGVPFVFGAVRLSRAIGLTIAGGQDDSGGRAKAAKPVALVVQIGLLSALGGVSIVIVEPFLPSSVGAFLLAGLATAAALALWRSANRFDVEVQAGAAAVMEALKARLVQGKDGDAAMHAAAKDVETILPGLGRPRMVRLEQQSPGVGRALGELDLRGKTGAAVFAVVRGESTKTLPEASEMLAAGDVVALVGTSEAVDEAQALLVGELASADSRAA